MCCVYGKNLLPAARWACPKLPLRVLCLHIDFQGLSLATQTPADGAGPTRPVTKLQVVHGALVICAFLLTAIGLTFFAFDSHFWAVASLATGVVLAIVVGFVSHRAFRLGFRTDQFRPGIGWDHQAVGASSLVVSPEQAYFFTNAIAAPATVRARVKDYISPATRAMNVVTEHTIQVRNHGGTDPLLMPLLVIKKGILLDSLKITDSAGGICQSFAFHESVQIIGQILLALVRADSEKMAARYQKDVEADLMALIGSASGKAIDPMEVGKVLGHLKAIVGRSETGRSAVFLANVFAYHYAVIVGLSSPGQTSLSRLTLTTTERQLLPMVVPRFRLVWPAPYLLDRMRKVFGVRPNTFVLPLQKADLCKSYHLEFMGPEGTYLARQRIVDWSDESESYGRLRARFGQRYAHLYIRASAKSDGSSKDPLPLARARIELSFFERPPGSLGAATLAALACAVLILVGGRIAYVPDAPRGDLVAVLLAFPGIAAAWVGLDRSTGAFGGTLAARLSAAMTLIVALVGTAMYLRAVPRLFQVDQVRLWGTEDVWALLTAVAVLNVGWVGYAWLRRAILYTTVLARNDPNAPMFREQDHRSTGDRS